MMVDVDIGLKMPSIFPLTVWDKLLVVIGEMDIGPTPPTLPPITQVIIVDCYIYLVLIAMMMILLVKMKEVIVGVVVQDVEVGLKISSTITFSIVYKVLIVMVEVDICLRPTPLPPIIQVGLVYHWFL